MENVLIVAELSEGKELKNATLSAIQFGYSCLAATGGSLDILVLGSDTKEAVLALQKHGARKVIVCEDPAFQAYLAEEFCPTVTTVSKSYALVVATATTYGKDLMPRVAARLDAAYATDCSGVHVDGNELVFKRPMFAGNAVGYATLKTANKVATVRQSEVSAHEPGSTESPVETAPRVPPGAARGRIESVALETVASERPDLGDAKIVVSGGRALKERFFEVLEPLADTLGAALGASRAAVDAGYCPGDFQVGQTGKIVAPSLYIAVGISGAIQHIAGMKSSKVIVAINKDPDAPIFQIADYGLVMDLFQAVPELVAALKAR